VLLLGGGLWFLLGNVDQDPNNSADATSSAATSSAGAAGILLDPAAFVGRPADDVETELEDAGLEVRREDADDDLIGSVDQELEAGDVAGLEPQNTFAEPGTEVTLFVVPQGSNDQPEETEETAEPSSEAPTSSAAPTPTTAPNESTPAESETPTSSDSGPGQNSGTLSGQPEASETTDLPPVEEDIVPPGDEIEAP